MASGPCAMTIGALAWTILPSGTARIEYLVEAAVLVQPIEEIVIESPLPCCVVLAAQQPEVRVCEVGLLHPVQQRVEAGEDGIACLMTAVVRVAAEVVVELRLPLVEPPTEVQLRHGELVLVRE